MAAKVYGWAVSPFVARALVCLEEAGADYELVPMIPTAGDHKKPEHLARNPFGQVPVLEDGDLMVFESRAIARHVFRKHKPELLQGRNLEESAMVDVWLEVEAHQHHPVVLDIVQQCIVNPLILGVERDQVVVDKNLEKLKRLLEVYEARLAASKFLAGDFVSVADLSHFPLMHYFMVTEYSHLVESCTNVKAWWEGLTARPSVKKVAALMPVDFAVTKRELP